MTRYLLLLAVGTTLLFTAACGPEDTPPAADPLPFEHWFPLAVDGTRLEAQIAVSRREQSRGLMHRQTLDTDRGMLFIYREPQRMSFWMKNTLIHLDIGFFDSEGVLREIHSMIAHDTTPTQSRSDEIRYALEMNARWFSENNIRPGVRLDLGLLREAIAARGAEVDRYVD
ncbi:MAG: DUF192 domain-containing protein [Opitutales bacterium]|nr:DUF192 domain-containing protein [Opitutales bacterium]